MTEGTIVFILILAVFFAIAILPSLIAYILGSIGKMRLLKSLGYKKPFIAFIPFARDYALGWMAQQLENGKKENKHGMFYTVISVISSIAGAIFKVLYFSLVVFSVITVFASGANDEMPFGPDYFYNQINAEKSKEPLELTVSEDEHDREDEENGDKDTPRQNEIETVMGLLTIVCVLIAIPASVLSIVKEVYGYCLFHNINKIFDSKNATLFTALTIGVKYILSIDIFEIMLFILSMRKKIPYNIRPTNPVYSRYCHIYYRPYYCGVPYAQQPYGMQYGAPQYGAPQYGTPQYTVPTQTAQTSKTQDTPDSNGADTDDRQSDRA